MKRILTALVFVFAFVFVSHAQVDNYCLRFTTTSGVVNLGRFTTQKSTSPYTLQMWICPAEWKQGAAIMRCGTFSIKLGANHALVINDGTDHFAVSSADLSTNTWTHLTVRGNSTDGTRVYINNSLVGSYPAKLAIPASEYSIWLGGGYKGRIDEVRLWRTSIAETYDSFWRTTLNELNPSWSSLVGYWKMDQEQCTNLVDYKGSHHGTLSLSGVKKEKVTDNERFKYLINLAYGNVERYFDRGIDAPHYWLSNRVSIIGATVDVDKGHANLYTPLDNAALAKGAERVDAFQSRTGVLSLPTAAARLETPAGLLSGAGNYTFETWLYLPQWTEGGYIFRYENADGTEGVSLRLGSEEELALILRCNGAEYKYPNAVKLNKWQHVGFCAGSNNKPTAAFQLGINGSAKSLTAENAPAAVVSNALPALTTTKATVGEGLVGYFDETCLWNMNRAPGTMADDSKAVPLPGADKTMPVSDYYYMRACYHYDKPANPGFDAFSVQGMMDKMRSNTEGMRGVKFTLTIIANNFESCLANAAKRKQIAQDIAEMGNSDEFDGVDLDFEWTYSATGWNNIALLCEAIRPLLKEGKILSESPHKVAYAYPTGKMGVVDYFNFQCYGPGDRDLCSMGGFRNAHNLFKSHGYPKEKIVLSYSTTTTSGFKGNSRDQSKAPQGYRYLYPGEDKYDPDQDYITASDGYDYYLAGYNQVMERAKYCVEQDLGGIMYWDLGNDLPATHKHCYAKAVSYYMNSNVEKLVTEVKNPAPAPADDTFGPIATPDPEDQGGLKESETITSLDKVDNAMAYNLINANGLGTLCHNSASEQVWLGASSNSNFAQPVDLGARNAAWLLINYKDKYYLYSLSAEKFVEVARFDVTSQACMLTDEPLPLEVTENGGTFAFRTYTNEEKGYLCASPQLAAKPVCQWTVTDNGSRWTLRTQPNLQVDADLAKALLKIDPDLAGATALTTDDRQPMAVGPAYDLQGRAYVRRPDSRGFYIIGGRKVMIK